MRLHRLHVTARLAATLLIAAGLALAVGRPLVAGSAPIRLVGVAGQGHQLTIEATEPVAYAVARPDDLVNLEFDLIAKYVERMLDRQALPPE